MKYIFYLLIAIFVCSQIKAQEKKPEAQVNLKELGVPNSPAFVIADISPTVVQTPTTPKEFIFGIGQAFRESESGFPQNYSLEFTPYWWFRPQGRDIYNFLGLTKPITGEKNPNAKQNPFYSFKFVNFSLAFLNKDLIPDSSKADQKIFSIGFRTTVMKINQQGHNKKLAQKIQQWHDEAVSEIDIEKAKLEFKLSKEPDSAKREKLRQEYEKNKVYPSDNTQKEIIDLINEKPIFSWDIASAHATYGIGDSAWKTGRFAFWTTISSYVPLAVSVEAEKQNYLSLNLFFRYMTDKFSLDKKNSLVKINKVDFGGKGGFEFGKLSIGVEAIHRFENKKADEQNRTIGYISYKIGDNLYINGAFGKNFGPKDKLISLVGINWGLGTEHISLPNDN